MAKPFQKLRLRMMEREVRNEDLARMLLTSQSAVSRRLNAKQDWSLEECYQVMEFLDLPASDMTKYFPRHGQNEAEVKRTVRLTRGQRRIV